MGNCISHSEKEARPVKVGKDERIQNYQVPLDALAHDLELQQTETETPSETSTQPTLTESAVQSVNAVSEVGLLGTSGGTRRPSSLGNSSSLMMIHEERQESFHSVYSHGSFASATSNEGNLQQARKRTGGRESPLKPYYEDQLTRDYIPNDEMKPFWQPMCFHITSNGFQDTQFAIVGHKVDVVEESGNTQTMGSEDTLLQQDFDVSVSGTNVQESIVFRISNEIEGLTCIKKITKGVMQCTLTEPMGDFQPGKHTYQFPNSIIPKGPFSRGQYHVVTQFVDSHGNELFSCEGDFKVVKQEITD
eukprot:TRINITY_DN6010_c1_g1_i2.p2 TRINITY_DN6010_c1_g1~~TRINITY_DN6010_c1_g1_i2.p2  ORF type:complete len:305 (-),score=35.66 TRINITY_DN6010_c1_g1_i2:580-1494(-)